MFLKDPVLLLYKTCALEPKPYFFFIATKKMPMQFLSFKNYFIVVLCNKIIEFLTQTKCPIRHVLCNIPLVGFFLQSPEEGNSK